MLFRHFAAGLLCLWLAGCSSERKAEPKAEAPAAPAFFKVDPATAAAITGKAVFKGKRPKAQTIKMDQEAACVRLHKGAVMNEEAVVNADGTLANVFVYVKSGLEGKTFEASASPVTIDQKGCMFRPHVLGIQTGQPFVVVNSDPVSHNIHPMPKENREWNQSQAPQTPNLERKFARGEVMIPVKCNVHAWMRSYVGVVDHPYFTVTGDQGRFDLKGLPPGEYTLAGWHEKFGAQEQKVTLAASGSQTVEFTFGGE